VANFFFLSQSDYFATPVDLSPMLHTWSLSVEEQFYLAYPIMLIVILRHARNRVGIVLEVCSVLSLAASLWATRTMPSAAFYLAPFRGWELLLGALVALGLMPSVRTAAAREWMAASGLVSILASACFFSDADPFPGVRALAPCLGTAAILYSGIKGSTRVNRLLSIKPLVFIGLISYSLYLWHWPILVLSRYVYSSNLPLGATLMALLLALALATLSWRLVELPFRDRRIIGRNTVFCAAAVTMAVITVASTSILFLAGLPQRFDRETLRIAAAANDVSLTKRQCLNRPPEDVSLGSLCRIGQDGDAQPTFLVWGDSHAAALIPAINDAAIRKGRSGLFAGQSACPPLIGVTRPREGSYYRCSEFNDQVLTLIQSTPSLHTIILAARWSISTEGLRYSGEAGGPVFIADNESKTLGLGENRSAFSRGLRRVMSALRDANKQIVLVGPIPEIGKPVPRALALQHVFGFGSRVAPTYVEFRNRQSYVMATLAAFGEEFNAPLVFPHEALCTDQTCRVEDHGYPLYADDNHLTATAARGLYMLFTPALE
jgi:hypothetical protein